MSLGNWSGISAYATNSTFDSLDATNMSFVDWSEPTPDAAYASNSTFHSSPESTSTLSDAQDISLFILPIISSLLSCWGSASIIIMIFKSDCVDSYKRVMLGLSCSDFLASVTLGFQAFLLPEDGYGRIWAVGNEASCTAMGFFQQVAFSALWYNWMLSTLFLLKIKYEVSEERLQRYYEPWMHIFSVFFPLITASIGAALDMYDEFAIGHYCWFTAAKARTYAFLVAGAPGFLSFVLVPVNNLLVYWHIRHTIPETDSELGGSSRSSIATLSSPCSSANCRGGGLGVLPPIGEHPMLTSAGEIANLQDILGPNQKETSLSNPRENGRPSSCTSIGSSTTSSNSAHSSPTQSVTTDELREQRRLNELQKLREKRHKKRLRAIANQGFLYVASFELSYMPLALFTAVTSFFVLEPSDDGRFYPLLAVQATLYPLQGLFNYLIYSKTRYVQELAVLADEELVPGETGSYQETMVVFDLVPVWNNGVGRTGRQSIQSASASLPSGCTSNCGLTQE